ncbi:meiotically up-regulated gene 113-domain-containing protein [Biscogniauxia marginata]|nr:meiotically up-regulated gene 113-domain-containing protein [Biscogniauxia marginata]
MSSTWIRAVWSQISDARRHLLGTKHGAVLRYYNSAKRQPYYDNSDSKDSAKYIGNSVLHKRYHQIQGPRKNKFEKAYWNISRQDTKPLQPSGTTVHSATEHSRSSTPVIQTRRLETISRPATPFLPSFLPYLIPLPGKIPSPPLGYPRHTTPPTPATATYVFPVNHRLEYYGREKSDFHINFEVQQKLLEPLQAAERRVGSLYAFHLPSSHLVNGGSSRGYVKIGRSDKPSRRIETIGRECKYTPQLVTVSEMPNYPRFERVVHLLLANVRMYESGGCPGCATHSRHREWFDIEARDAEALIKAWQRWAMLRPYDRDGHLLPGWRHRVEKLDLTEPRCWDMFLNGLLL